MYQAARRKPNGYMVTNGPMGIVENDTTQCCHCNSHFIMKPGSGTIRGFCTKCHAITCGNPKCNPCVPFEEKLRLMEK